ncbi:MAG TPA: hypothetical protein PKC84_09000, partial [Paracoccaceae bacterium]|nr:hypothetical protein [Paracoccaceae bacterium]
MADLLLHNARIRTMDPARPYAEWMLMRDSRILALGQGAAPDCAGRAAAGGRGVLPGFQDAPAPPLSGRLDLATPAQLY